MSPTCTTCQTVATRQWGRRVYADALVMVLIGRDNTGHRELWVLPRQHSPKDASRVCEHSWTVARRAAAALADAGIPFALDKATWQAEGAAVGAAASNRNPAESHALLRIPEAVTREDSGVFRLPAEALADRERLRPA